MTTIYLIRHGQAEGNLYRRCHSWHNGLLTLRGREQVKALEKRFENVHFDAVYSSDLYRAMSTAGAIYRPRGLPLRIDPGLREIGAGIWEDVPWGQLLHDHRESLTTFLSCDDSWQVEDCETFPQVRARVDQSIRRIAAAHPDQTVAVVSHGCAIRCGLSVWLQTATGQIPLGDNTSVAKLEVEDGRVSVAYYNDSSHLPPLSAAFRAGAAYGIPGIERNALRCTPLSLSGDKQRYLAARREHWQAVYGTADGFDASTLWAAAEKCRSQDAGCLLNVWLGDRFAGLLQMDWARDAAQQAGWISFLYLTPELRGQGLGVQLLGQAVSVYRAMGRQSLRLCCPAGNGRAGKFFLSHGFQKTGGAADAAQTMEKYIGLEL